MRSLPALSPPLRLELHRQNETGGRRAHADRGIARSQSQVSPKGTSLLPQHTATLTTARTPVSPPKSLRHSAGAGVDGSDRKYALKGPTPLLRDVLCFLEGL